jgi:hypothetical protein
MNRTMGQLPERVAAKTRQRCACCGAERVVPETRIIVGGEAYCIPCERAIRSAPNVELTPEARAFVKRLEAKAIALSVSSVEEA